MPKLLICTVAAAVFAAPAAAASVPFWWWTPAQANTNVVRANPQRIDFKGHETTITQAACKGTGAAKSGRYRSFDCLVRFHDDTLDCCSFGLHIYVTTSKTKRNALACWSRSQVALDRGECRPPKIG